MSDDEALDRALASFFALERDEQAWLLLQLTQPELRALGELWPVWAHEGQLPPPGDWRVWLMMAGRGFGKTRAGAEWVSEAARGDGSLRIALVAATVAEVERVMVKGASGLLKVARFDEDMLWYPTRGLVEFASGAKAFAYSGANPEGLRGPEHHLAWCDELAKWAHPQGTWDNLMLGLRLGDGARVLVTTTPRPIPLLRRLAADPAVAQSRGGTADNPHLPEDFVGAMVSRYGGTRLGRQELEGALIEEIAGALWTREGIEACRAVLRDGASTGSAPPQDEREFWKRVVIGVDPPASAAGDDCGIVVCGLGADGIGYVLDDRSAGGLSPEGWAQAVVSAAEFWAADRVVVETNQGGEMVESVLRSVDSALPVRAVKARFGKGRRAEPVSALFAQRKARFAGAFPELEDELCGLTADGYEGPGRSPDRADAMVWAMAELLLGRRRIPQVRGL